MEIPEELAQDFARQRERMVARNIAGRGISDPLVLQAMAQVERHRFVNPVDWDEAYADHPLGIGCKQTISQPYIVAYMTETLRVQAGMRVLEIGTGCGYQTAVLLAIGCEVYTVERHEALQQQAAQRLADLGVGKRLHTRVGDGSQGWVAQAPFDRILVTAAAEIVPEPLVCQLAEGGRIVLPVGTTSQSLRIGENQDGSMNWQEDLAVVFVPLIRGE